MYRLSAMRMQRAGLMPSAEAAAMSEVVLKGTGAGTLRRFFSTEATRALTAPSTWAMAAAASASALKRAVAWGASKASGPSPAVGPVVAPPSKAPRMTQ